MRASTSSRLNPKVICVRSLVPKEKKSATSAISSARTAARGVSIMVPMVTARPFLSGALHRRDGVLHPAAGEEHLLAGDGERDHDLDDRLLAGGVELDGGLHQRPHLHGVEPGLEHAEATPLSTPRRTPRVPSIGFCSAHDWAAASRSVSAASRPSRRPLHEQLLHRRQELVQRRVEQPDRDGQAVHGVEDLEEVGLLGGAQLLEGGRLLVRGVGEDHRPHDRQAVLAEEHVLGAAQADALGAEVAGDLGVLAGVGVGPHRELALPDAVGPAEDDVELRRRLGVGQRHGAEHDLAGGAVEGDGVALAPR